MPQTDRPNLLFIMDDQHRHDYLGCAGADFIQTPNIDRLAVRGVRFTHCTTNAPVCAPARIGLATGLQPTRLGALDNQAFLPRRVPTYYQHLRDHGYRVGCAGKLDLAKPDGYNGRYGDRPAVYGWGFTHPIEIEGKMHAGNFAEPRGPYGHFLQERGLYDAFHADYVARARAGWSRGYDDSVLPTDAFADYYIGQRAAEWINTIADDFPWHMFVSFVGPHDPYDPPTEYADRYRSAAMPAPIPADFEGKPDWVTARQRGLSAEEVAITQRQYCAATTLIDDQIGVILDALDTRGMTENTMIIFASDHGEMLGDFGLFTKSFAYESAWRVPLIAAGPGIQQGVISDALVELIDVNATLTDLAGLPQQPGLDAQSFAPILRGEADTHRTDTVGALRHFRVIRTRTHKLIENYNAAAELYDLENDPQEQHNIAAENPDTVHELSARLRQRYTEGAWMRG